MNLLTPIRMTALLTALFLIPAAVSAAPTPIPGGANQLKGVTGTLSSTLFNGMVRVRKMQLHASTAAEATAPAGGQAITFTYLVSNGSSKNQYGGASASLADADGVLVNGHPVGVYGAYFSILPGAVARGTIAFTYDSSFKPVKLLLTPPNGPIFRINLKPSDLPAAPAPAATTTP